MRRIPFAAAAILAATLAWAARMPTTTGPEACLIFGYYDMSDSPYPLRAVVVSGDQKSGIAYPETEMATYDDGLFFLENVKPMGYIIGRFMAGKVMHMVVDRKNPDIRRVKPGSLYFMGAWKYTLIKKAGSIKKGQFEMTPLKGREAAALKMLLPRVKDERWKKRIQARLNELK